MQPTPIQRAIEWAMLCAKHTIPRDDYEAGKLVAFNSFIEHLTELLPIERILFEEAYDEGKTHGHP